MPRYYFHLVRNDRRIIDCNGMKLLNLEAARVEAIEAAIVVRAISPGSLSNDARFRIADEDDNTLLTVRFRDVFA